MQPVNKSTLLALKSAIGWSSRSRTAEDKVREKQFGDLRSSSHGSLEESPGGAAGVAQIAPSRKSGTSQSRSRNGQLTSKTGEALQQGRRAVEPAKQSERGVSFLDSANTRRTEEPQHNEVQKQALRELIVVSKFLPDSLKSCTWSMSEFSVVKMLYRARTSQVYHAQHRASGTSVALKFYTKACMVDTQVVQTAREIWFHANMDCHRVISMYAAWVECGKIVIAIEFSPIGSAFRKLKKVGCFSEQVAAQHVIFPVLCALRFMHSIGLVHRDIKPENVLLVPDGCKLADLGLVIHHQLEAANTCAGTFDYMAPEIFDLPNKKHPFELKNQHNPKVDEKVDVWAVGVLAYELVQGQCPFHCNSQVQTVKLIMEGIDHHLDRLALDASVSRDYLDFLRQCMQRSPGARMTVAELLAHPWIGAHCPGNPVELERQMRSRSHEAISAAPFKWEEILHALGGVSDMSALNI